MVINAYKPVGKTPLQVVKKLKEVNPELGNKKIGYAGRLDPMAEGVLILLVEPETKNRDNYQKLDKQYQFEILFGIETDTLDVLGLVTKEDDQEIDEHDLEKVVTGLEGSIQLPYPAYSSKTVEGKPLFWWARQNKLDEIKIPIKTSEIYSLSLQKMKEVKKSEIEDNIFRKVSLVKGDFRQDQISKRWNDFFKRTKKERFTIAILNSKVSSGTYIRSLSKLIANSLGTSGIALKIKRTGVGIFDINKSNNFFKRSGEITPGL